MAGYEHILVGNEDGVGIVTLNRPEKLNAMNRKLNAELHDAVKRMEADDAIGCIVITGAGDRAFSAGGDIHEQIEDDRRYSDEERKFMQGGRRSCERKQDEHKKTGPNQFLLWGPVYALLCILLAQRPQRPRLQRSDILL